MIKIIAVGNRFMKDDGVSLLIADFLKDKLDYADVEIIMGETDCESCFYSINDTDYIVIIDALYSGSKPGSIHIYNLQEELTKATYLNARHDSSLIDLMKLNRKIYKGLIIGIEAAEVSFGNELSSPLKERFFNICAEVEQTIRLVSII